MLEDDQEAFNCELFDTIKRKWQKNQIDKDYVRQFIWKTVPEHADRIIGWFERPIKDGPHNILTLAKFDE